LLRGTARFPALAVELGAVRSEQVAAGGLRALRGTATYYLAAGQADEAGLLANAEQYIDALRQTVEVTLQADFQRLSFAGANVEGEPLTEAGLAVRLLPVSFEFEWLYNEGDL
jgi:hypothetical protein